MGLAERKGSPRFTWGSASIEMFIAISETIARPENNAKGSAAGRELQGTDLKAYRGTTKIRHSNSRSAVPNFCVISGLAIDSSPTAERVFLPEEG